VEKTRYRFVIGGLLLCLNFAVGMNFFAVSPLLPLIVEEYGVSRGVASLLIGLVPLAQAALSIPGGLLAAKVRLKPLVAVCWFASAGLILTPLASDFGALMALRLGFGIGIAVLMPVSGMLLMQWFPRRELPLVNGMMMVGGTLGVTLALFTEAALAEAVGWQGALMLPGAVMLAGAVLWVALGRTTQVTRQPGRPAVSARQMLTTLRARVTLLIALGNAAPTALMVAQMSWLPTYFNETLGMSLSKGGMLTGLMPFSGMVWMFLGGLLPLFFARRRPFLLVPGVTIVFAGLSTFLAGDTLFIYPALIVLSFSGNFFLPTLATLPMELPDATPDRVVMMLAGSMTVGGFFAFVSPLTVGLLADATGSYVPGFALWSVAGVGLLVAALLLPETGRTRDAPGSGAKAVGPAPGV